MVRRHDLARLVRKMHAVFDGNVRRDFDDSDEDDDSEGAVPWYEQVQNRFQFLDWWEDPTRTHTIGPPRFLRPSYSSFRRTPATYRHDDAFLLALLRDAQERRDYEARERRLEAMMPEELRMNSEREDEEQEDEEHGYFDFEENSDLSGTNVDVAWRSLCWFFYEDTNPQRLHYDT
jgi:hypothetical protein